jgi:hypothetical protein
MMKIEKMIKMVKICDLDVLQLVGQFQLTSWRRAKGRTLLFLIGQIPIGLGYPCPSLRVLRTPMSRRLRNIGPQLQKKSQTNHDQP